MSKLQAALSNISFNAMTANLKMYEKLHLPVISTARPFSFYRKVFFDDRETASVLQEITGKRIVDIGCGLTPFTADSMFQVCRRNGIDFFGIDPKLAKGFKFGVFDKLKSIATGAASMPRANMPGQEKAIAAFADDLPFEDKSIDIILSSWLLFAWIQDEDLLFNIFSEFDRILKSGGKISFYPSMHWSGIERKYPRLAKQLVNYKKQQRFLFGFNPGSLPPTFVTQLKKRQ